MTEERDDDARSGLDELRARRDAGQLAPMLNLLAISIAEIERGYVVFEGAPRAAFDNPAGTTHGGYAATILDSACGCAVYSMLDADQGYATLDIKVAFHRPLTAASGVVRSEGRVVSFGRRVAFAEATLTDAQGRLCASATSTLAVLTPSGDRPRPTRS